jgi:hypothetical protein
MGSIWLGALDDNARRSRRAPQAMRGARRASSHGIAARRREAGLSTEYPSH